MKLGIYSTMVIPTNPNLNQYGGLEAIAGLQAKYFAEQGHEVHLFAPMNSIFSTEKDGTRTYENGHLYAVGEAGKVHPDDAFKAYLNDPNTRQVLRDCELICDHSWEWYVYGIHQELKHLVHVHHGPTLPFSTPPPVQYPNCIAVGFNHAKMMMRYNPSLQWRAVQNAIDVSVFKYNNTPIAERERLLWISRIYFPKGAHRAIEIANRLKMPLDICGGSFGDDPNYSKQIQEACAKSENITFHGEVPFEKKAELYHHAKAVILPIVETGMTMSNGQPFEWHEPFGLCTPEANASGTPVVVAPNCGWNESMIHGYNGFFANTDKEFEYYIKKIDTIKPEDCRAMAERFDYPIMGKNYEDLFNEVLHGEQW